MLPSPLGKPLHCDLVRQKPLELLVRAVASEKFFWERVKIASRIEDIQTDRTAVAVEPVLQILLYFLLHLFLRLVI